MIEIVETDSVAKSASPLNQALKAGDFLFVSGQLGRHPETGDIVQPFSAEVKQTMDNLSEILKQAGLTFDDVVKTNIYVTDIASVKELNSIYKEYLGDKYPARCCVEVNRLAKDAKVEIELIAYMP